MPTEEFEHMLEAMPKIADAIKQLPQELHDKAFDALISSLRGSPSDKAGARSSATDLHARPRDSEEDQTDAAESIETDQNGSSPRTRRAAKSAPAKRQGRRSWAPVRDIDFRAPGKKAFRELIEEKQPNSNLQKNLLAVYWLEQIYEVSEIGVGHVLAAFKEANWREPSHPDTTLQQTASAKHWLDTADMKHIKTTASGRNAVEHDMPIPSSKTKK